MVLWFVSWVAASQCSYQIQFKFSFDSSQYPKIVSFVVAVIMIRCIWFDFLLLNIFVKSQHEKIDDALTNKTCETVTLSVIMMIYVRTGMRCVQMMVNDDWNQKMVFLINGTLHILSLIKYDNICSFVFLTKRPIVSPVFCENSCNFRNFVFFFLSK